MSSYLCLLAVAAAVSAALDRLFGERCRHRAVACGLVAGVALLAGFSGASAVFGYGPDAAEGSRDVPLIAAAALAVVLAAVGVASPKVGPRPAAVLLLTLAGFVGGPHPFGAFVLAWWFADRAAFRRPVWTLAAMAAASVGLDGFRETPGVAGASLMTLSLIAAWAGRPHRGQQVVVSAAFAAAVLLKFGWLTGPASLRPIVTAACVAAVAGFALAAGRRARRDRGPEGVAWSAAGALLLLAAAAECMGSGRSGLLLVAACGTPAAAAVVENRVRRVGRLGIAGRVALTGLLPAVPLTAGLVWWPAIVDLLSVTVDSPMTGVPEPSGAAGLLATLIVVGPLMSAGAWLAGGGDLERAALD